MGPKDNTKWNFDTKCDLFLFARQVRLQANPNTMKTTITCAALLLFAAIIPMSGADTGQTRLFILSGQSNMEGLDPEESFAPTLRKAFPADEIIVAKHSQSGQPIRRWDAEWKSASGQPPEVRKGQKGDLYDKLLAEVKKALEGKPRPASVVFVWMQGEADTHSAENADVYGASLKTVISNLRKDLERPDMAFVIGRISDFAKYPEGSKTVREAQVAVAESDPLGGWIDTDDLNGSNNALHYMGEGKRKLGERFAEKATNMLSSKPVKK